MMHLHHLRRTTRARGFAVGVLLALTVSGCGGRDAPPVGAPEPALIGVAVDSVIFEEELIPTDPELSLEGRWSAPFAVYSTGRPPARPPRPPVVVVGESQEAAAAPPVAAALVEEPAAAPATQPAPAPQPAAAPQPTAPPQAAPPAGLTAAAPPRAGAGSAAANRTHRVEWGETWLAIARRYSVSAAALAAANPGVEPNRIRSGQVLRIPAAGAAAAPTRRTHVVGAGDTLWGIARRYGLTAEQIRSANNMQDDRVRLGQTLVIPGSERN